MTHSREFFDSELPPCSGCRHCVEVIKVDPQNQLRKYQRMALCVNENIPIDQVHPAFSPALNLELQNRSNLADQIKKGTFRFFLPRLSVINSLDPRKK